MKEFIALIWIDLKRAIISKRFLFCVIAVAFVLYLAIFKVLQSNTGMDVLSVLGLAIGGSGTTTLILGVLPIIPFATNFASEWRQRSTSFWMIRSGITKYALSKVIVSFISGFATTAVGVVVFILIIQMQLPFFIENATGDPYAILLESNRPILYAIYYIVHLSLASALFAVLALFISTYIPNQFVTIAMPNVVYFISHRFTTTLDIPVYFKVVVLVEWMYDMGTPNLSLLYKFSVVSLLCILLGIGIIMQIRRRVQHD